MKGRVRLKKLILKINHKLGKYSNFKTKTVRKHEFVRPEECKTEKLET